jgi:hypothetical protein
MFNDTISLFCCFVNMVWMASPDTDRNRLSAAEDVEKSLRERDALRKQVSSLFSSSDGTKVHGSAF